MFTDTKNLANANNSSNGSGSNALELSFAKSNDRSKGKLRKVWKPLLRLITLKSATTKSGSGCAAIKHPNNVNLNNTSNSNTHAYADSHSKDIYEMSAAQLQDFADALRSKVSPPTSTTTATTSAAQEIISAPVYNHSTAATELPLSAEKITRDTPTVISSASIEKTPTPTCNGCAYGRNCQHEQFHRLPLTEYHPSSSSLSGSVSPQALTALPVHYIRTEDGSFFWTPAHEKIDDDLLNALLCQSFRQYPLEALVC